MISIKPNTYSAPTEIREDVVQYICNILLDGDIWHPVRENRYRTANNRIMGDRGYDYKDGKKVYNGRDMAPYKFADYYWDQYASEHIIIPFHECEMRKAFEIILANGYHIYEVYEYGSWNGYRVSDRPYYDGGREVKTFTEHWD